MTSITIDLTDQQISELRARYYPVRHSIARQVLSTLPPERIEPKAGGTCRVSGGHRLAKS